jgi:two-component system phosphate regulon response regulator PhoB
MNLFRFDKFPGDLLPAAPTLQTTRRTGFGNRVIDAIEISSFPATAAFPFLLDGKMGADNYCRNTPDSNRETHYTVSPRYQQAAEAHGNTGAAAADSRFDQRPPVLLVAHELRLREYLKRVVTQAGYHVVKAETACEALRILAQFGRFDLVLIHNVPDMASTDLCKQVRLQLGRGPATSVIVVSENFDENAAVDALMSGASDFISGPHLNSERVLLARLHVALRSYHLPGLIDPTSDADSIRVGSLVISPSAFQVVVDGECDEISLTPIQFKILHRLARRPGRVFVHEELRETIAEFGGSPDDRTVKSHVSHLRKRLGEAGNMIKTVRGVGYKLEE